VQTGINNTLYFYVVILKQHIILNVMNIATLLLGLVLLGITCTDMSAESNDAPAAVREPVRLTDPRAVAGWLRKFSGANGCYTFLLRFLSDGRPQNL
jgi:hypothetical protein